MLPASLLVATLLTSMQADSLERSALRLGLLATLVPVATGAALVATQDDDAAPLVFVAAGLVVGPALGYQRARMGGRGWGGAALRAGLTLGSLAGAVAVCWDCSESEEQAAWAVLIGGSALVAASAIYDLARIPHNVRRHEARRLSVTPWIEPHRGGITANLSL